MRIIFSTGSLNLSRFGSLGSQGVDIVGTALVAVRCGHPQGVPLGNRPEIPEISRFVHRCVYRHVYRHVYHAVGLPPQ